MPKNSPIDEIFTRIIIDDEGRACKDIPESACEEEPKNFFTHVGSLFLSKTADGLVDPKLVLSWLITTLGGSSSVVGLLVPVREAGALLPQLFTAGTIRKLQLRKYAWAVGSALQGLSAIGIGLSALVTSGERSGWLILFFLLTLALARSICSVSYKDVLGKTVSKSRRGSATGLASSVSALSVIAFAILLSLDTLPRLSVVLSGIFIAGGLWIIAAFLFLTLEEKRGATDGGKSSIVSAFENLKLLKTDRQLQLFVLVRALLTATALAPPFMISAAKGDDLKTFGGLGILLLASASSALMSAFVWGRLSDRSSRKVLVFSGLISALALVGTALALTNGYLSEGVTLPALLFVLMTAYQGVRLGRSTHLVDMGTSETRAAYTALSNTVIGLVLIAGGLFSVIAGTFGVNVVLWIMATMCLFAAISAITLDEVQ